MTDKCALRDEAKKHVRALLLSSPVPLTVQELEKDYHTFIGEQLPYRKMGYSCLEDFFRDINDAVQIHWKNGMMTLQAIADETNRHIQKLVSKQKISNTKKYAVLRKGRGRGPSAQQRFGGASHYRPPPSPKPFIPAYIQNNIKQLFHSFPQGVQLTDFDKAFSRRFGMQINYQKYGFHSIKEFLGSLLDLVRLQEEKGDWLVLPTDSFKKLKEPTKLVSPLRNPEPAVPQKTVNEVARPSKGRGRRREKSGGSNERSSTSMDGEGAKSIDSMDAADISTQFDDDVGINHLVQEELMQLFEKSPDGIWSNNLLALYKDTYKKDLVFKEFGYLSVIEFVSALPDIVHIERPSPQGDWKLYDARKPMPKETKVASIKSHQSQKGVDEELKEVIQRLLCYYPTGIPVEEFPSQFQQFSGECIIPEKFGFTSMQSLLLSLDNSALQLVCRGDGRLMLYSLDVDPTVIDEEREMENCEQPSPKPAKGQIPIDAVGPGVFYTPVQPPKLNEFFEVYVSNVVSPGLFWIQLKGKSTTWALEDLMDHLDAVYSGKDAAEYKMPHEFINRGQVCVTLFPEDSNWHRGVIVNLTSDDFVEVYYVDYGNTCSVHRNSLRFMKIEFMKLPTQAIQSRLCNIQPARGRRSWCRRARDRLLNIVVNKPLIAYATNEKDGVFSVLLTDTNSSVDIHLNDLLVHEGYAVFSQDTSSDMAGPIVHDQLPDYTYVYGEQAQHKPRLPKAAANTGATTSQTTPRFVKWLQLTAHETLHIINLNDIAYVLSSEISAFFWDADILYNELIEKNMTVPKIMATKAEYPGLFEELKRFKLDVAENEDEQYTCVPLYQLDSLPNILRVFEHESDKLIRAVEKVILNFNPKDPYWKGEVTEKGDENAKKVDTKSHKKQPLANEINVDILQLSLQVLRMNRKRILQTLMEQPSPEIVNELHDVEEHILELQDTITTSKKQSETQPAKSTTCIKSGTASQDKTSEPQQCTEDKASPEKIGTITHTNSKHIDAVTSENQSTSSTTSNPKTNIVWPMVHQKDPSQKLISQSVPVSLSTNMPQTPTVLRGVMRPDVQAQMLQNRQLMNLQDNQSVSLADTTIPQNQSVSLPEATIPQNQSISSANTAVPQNQSVSSANTALPQNQTVTSANVTMPLNQSVFANYENYMQQHTMLFQPVVLTQFGMMPGMNMGLLPSVAPLLYTGLPVPSLMGTQASPPVTTAGMGRGQPITNDMGLLPELIPLLQNLRMNQARGRGFGGPGGPSGNS